MVTVTPKITDALLVNPGVGFIAAPALMQNEGEICDNRGTQVSRYRFTPESKTSNHPDSGVYYCGARWKDLEPVQGEFAWEILDKKLAEAQEMGCTAVVRVAPYALAEDEDVPAWLRAKWPEMPEFPFWKVDPNTTDYPQHWARFVRELAKRYDGHPVISSVDMAIVGAWGEGGGTEFMEDEALDGILAAYIEGFVQTPLQALLHDDRSIGKIRSYRSKVGFRVDCLGDMGGFHPGQWSHMMDFYPQNIVNFGMENAWKQAPVVFEACWHMNDWYLQGWDIDYIVDESLKWHISSYNSKGTTVPEEWKESVARWVRKMGYRFELHQLSFGKTAAAGGTLPFEMLVTNSGVAPSYHNYPPVLRLSGGGEIADIPIAADIRTWMPDEDVLLAAELAVPAGIKPGEYTVSIGFPVPHYKNQTLELAVEGRGKDGFYLMGSIEITQ